MLEEEQTARANAETKRRLRKAGFPLAPTNRAIRLPPRSQAPGSAALFLDPGVEQACSLAPIGAPGLRQTMLAIATKLVQLGYSARFITAQPRPPTGDENEALSNCSGGVEGRPILE